jgi:hypothetical protein
MHSPPHSNIILISQTCFCCVLAAQLAESSPVPQLARRDEIAAEMLKILTKPFMVRSFFAFSSHTDAQLFLVAFSLRHTALPRLRFSCFCPSCSVQAGIEDQNHAAKVCARMLKGCFR